MTVAVGGCRGSVAERWRRKPEALGWIPSGTTFLSFPLLFQLYSDSNGPDHLQLDNHYQSLDYGGVLSIGLPMLWLCSPSITQQMNTYSSYWQPDNHWYGPNAIDLCSRWSPRVVRKLIFGSFVALLAQNSIQHIGTSAMVSYRANSNCTSVFM